MIRSILSVLVMLAGALTPSGGLGSTLVDPPVTVTNVPDDWKSHQFWASAFSMAVPFTTDTGSYVLRSVSVPGAAAGGSDAARTVTFGLYSDAGGLPGSLLTPLGSIIAPAHISNLFVFDFSASTPVTLDPDSTYWFALHNPPEDRYSFSWAYDFTFDSSLGEVSPDPFEWSIGDHHAFITHASGGAWVPSSSAPLETRLVEVRADPVPEPALPLLVLGFPLLALARRRR